MNTIKCLDYYLAPEFPSAKRIIDVSDQEIPNMMAILPCLDANTNIIVQTKWNSHYRAALQAKDILITTPDYVF